MLTRYITSFVRNLLNTSPRHTWKMKTNQLHTTDTMQGKKKKGWKWYTRKKKPHGLKIIKPYDCTDSPKPLLHPACKIAIVVGGSDGFGFAAADHLLCKGARRIIIVDNDPDQGYMAAQRLCDSYGKNRVQYLDCDVNNACQFEATLSQTLSKNTQVHILFNDLDKERFPSKCSDKNSKKKNYVSQVVQVGMKFLGKNNGGPGGIIVNCASILGFIGWPKDPFPIYCKKEPAIEVTMDFAEEFNIKKTGVRLVALCPINKQFPDINLPEFPDPIPNNQIQERPSCVPTSKNQIGSALSYVMAWAKNGSTWLVEPAISVYQIPRLIHFPMKEGEQVDPKIYEDENYNKIIFYSYV
ncbi:15-hydroxyprostaglandin dehydrogenase [NAD(+)] [Ptiloglossa arizonensis]|uniref:15-hydroxyprostaglandin dehydrogenase [NAD(+)] n=1 Tax=Ptiloglossa arizonensis TaxID=3350558 RepID=UPI003FA0464A